MRSGDEQRLVAVDVGGTFTDLVMFDGTSGLLKFAKVPSTPPDFFDGVVSAIAQVLPDFSQMDMFVHGTTMHLNAFLERKGAKTALVTTQGFGDIYEMRRGNRVRMYDLHYQNPEPLTPRRLVAEVEERLDAKGEVVVPISAASVSKAVELIRNQGAEAVAICLLHSYRNSEHEEAIAREFERLAPEIFVSPSHLVCREWREFERMSTVVLNAYVSPILARYLKRLREDLDRRGYRRSVYLMQSSGGLMKAQEAESRGVYSLLSGPVGGNVGGSILSAMTGEKNLICIDMGGTSFEVSLIIDGKSEVASDKELGGNPVLVPMIDLHTIGAGGGSVAWNDHGAMRVGPQSAGASPGPACYGRGGSSPTVTDANLVLGRINDESLFGGAIRLDAAKARTAISNIGAEFGLECEAAAEGVLHIINAKMANAIRTMTVSRGIDPRDFAIVAYGGAGPMHAAFIAEELGIDKVIVPNLAGAFSAWGMLQTEGRHDLSQTLVALVDEADWRKVAFGFEELEIEVSLQIESEILSSGAVRFQHALDLRYVGQEYFLTVPVSASIDEEGASDLRSRFDQIYEKRFGHSSPQAPVEMVNIRVQAQYRLHNAEIRAESEAGELKAPTLRRVMLDHAWYDCPFYRRESMDTSAVYPGPLVIEESSCTTVVSTTFQTRFDSLGNIILERGAAS